MSTLRCPGCFGSGRVMGGGMISTIDCPQCDGEGIKKEKVEIVYKQDKRKKSYKDAVNRLTEKGCSEAEAKQYLADELKESF